VPGEIVAALAEWADVSPIAAEIPAAVGGQVNMNLPPRSGQPGSSGLSLGAPRPLSAVVSHGVTAADLATPPLFPIDQTEFETALSADHANVAETARKIDRDEVIAAIDLLSRAERIVLCGTDQMAFFASYLRHLLMLLDLRAEVVASPSQEGLAKLGRVDDKTVMVGFSAGRPHPLVVRAMKLGRNRRAATIAIADATLSEVAKLADHRLYYSSNSPAYVRSHTALLGLIQALAYGVYALDESAYADRIRAFRLK